ncbi:TonB-dependent receptor [Rheinheimera sp.]|uniref:TonB-dependent receptor n=1 Tax=Rheinheimera sp. TaxID=1869214 RepID=UPI002737460A|nr:TonB-dependent receptor [Rheinheimera sp.]MDP2714625.1 TonB-dependent receptor [Rheinheimera sp.]
MAALQQVSAETNTHYSQTELAQMSGQSVLDIIEQVAGFRFIDSNSQRGLSNASGNVLINGLPVLNKSQSLADMLAGMPVSQLGAMEVYLAGHPFTAASQYTQVINLLRHTVQRPISWRIAAGSALGMQQPQTLSLQSSTGWHGWDHQLQVRREKDLLQSHSRFFHTGADNSPYLSGSEDYSDSTKDSNLAITSARPLRNSYLQLNSQWQEQGYQERYRRNWQQNTAVETEIIDSRNKQQQFELGLDWQQQANDDDGWLWQVSGLYRRQRSDYHSQTGTAEQDNNSTELFSQRKTLTEQVIKFSSQQATLWWQPELGFELSLNRLDANTLVQGMLTTTVREYRAEPYIASKVQLNDHWQWYAKLTGEYATLQSETQQYYQTQNRYVKPLIKLSHQAKNGLQSTFTLQRKVEQLDFADFIAGLDNDFGREQAGNAQLKPQQRLELSYELNYGMSADWALNTQLFWHKIDDIHEFVQFDAEAWGIANAGRASYSGADIKLNLSSHWLVQGSEITLQYSFRDARYADPLTGNRAISWLTPHSGDIELRKNADGYAWGLLIDFANIETAFYPDEVYRQKNNATTDIYAEFSLRRGLTLDIAINNLFGVGYKYQRDVFMPDRSNAVAYRYYSLERSDPSLVIALSGNF